MGVERRDLIDFGLRQTHLFGQSADVRGGQMAVGILDQVKEFDQQIAAARAVAQKVADLGHWNMTAAAIRESVRQGGWSMGY